MKCLLLMYLTPLVVDAACRGRRLDESTQFGRGQRCIGAVSNAVSLRNRPAQEIGPVQLCQGCEGSVSNYVYFRGRGAQEDRPVQQCQGCKESVSNAVSFRDRPVQQINPVQPCHHCTGGLSNSVNLKYRPAQTMRLTLPCQRCTGAVSNVVRLREHPESQSPEESSDAIGPGLTMPSEVPNDPDSVTGLPLPLYDSPNSNFHGTTLQMEREDVAFHIAHHDAIQPNELYDLKNENKPYLIPFPIGYPLQSTKGTGNSADASSKFQFPIFISKFDPSQNTNFPIPPPVPSLNVDDDPCSDPESPLCAFSQGRIFADPSATSQLTHIQTNPSARKPFGTESVGRLIPDGAVLNYNLLPLEQIHPKHDLSASYLNEAAAAHTGQVTISPPKENEDNIERLCNDPFHSFLCKPITKQRQRLTGMLRPQAVLPPNIENAASSVQLSGRLRPDQRSHSYGPVLSDSVITTVTGSHRQITEKSTSSYDPSKSQRNLAKPTYEQLPLYDYKTAPEPAVHVNKYNPDTGFFNTNPLLKAKLISKYTQSTSSPIHTEPTNNFLFTIKPVHVDQNPNHYQVTSADPKNTVENIQTARNNMRNNKKGIQTAAAIQPEAIVQVPKDDYDNLERLCNDPFHSFLCKPITKQRQRFTGKLRPNAQIPPGVHSVGVSPTTLFKDPPVEKSATNVQTVYIPHGTASLPFLDTVNYGDSFLSPNPSNVVKSIVPPNVPELAYQKMYLRPSEEVQFIVPTSTIKPDGYFYAKPPSDRQFLLPPTFTHKSQTDISESLSGSTRPLAAESTYLNPNRIIPPSVPEPPPVPTGKLSTPQNIEAEPAHHIAAVSNHTIDQEDNLERLCNDPFHSFLCKPTKPRQRITGKLRDTASVLAAVLAGQSSIQRPSKLRPEGVGKELEVSTFTSTQSSLKTKPLSGFDSSQASDHLGFRPPIVSAFTPTVGRQYSFNKDATVVVPSSSLIESAKIRPSGGYTYTKPTEIPPTEIPLTKQYNLIPQTTFDSATIIFPPNDFYTSSGQSENGQTSSSTQEELAGISGYSYPKPNTIDQLDIRIRN